MEKFIINGGTPLKGEVEISGAKNAALAIIPAAILSQDVCVIENLPCSISDIGYMMKILNQIGAQIKVINKHTIEIDSRRVNSYVISHDMTKHLRASYYFIGALLGRFSRARLQCPAAATSVQDPLTSTSKAFSFSVQTFRLRITQPLTQKRSSLSVARFILTLFPLVQRSIFFLPL